MTGVQTCALPILTVILVTHDHNVAMNTKRQVVLRDGQIVLDTTDAEKALKLLYSTAEPAAAEGN